jgi:hypothetical protein
MVGHQQFSPGRTGSDASTVHTAVVAFGEHQILSVSAHQFGDGDPRLVDQRSRFAQDELHRGTLEPLANGGGSLLHRARARSKALCSGR